MKIGMSRRLMGALGIGTALSLALVSYSFGQNPPAPSGIEAQQRDRGPGPGPGPRQGGPGPLGGFGFRMDERLDALHERLEIRPSQEQAWQAFAAIVRDQAQVARTQAEAALRERDNRRAPPTLIEGLERRRQILTTMRDGVDRVLNAVQPLYAALDNNQKRVADRVLSRVGGQGGPGGRGPGPGPQGRFFNRPAPDQGPGPFGGRNRF